MAELKPCPFCSTIPRTVCDDTQKMVVSMYHNQKSGNIGLIIAKKTGGVDIDVAFCPWCGRDLRRADNG